MLMDSVSLQFQDTLFPYALKNVEEYLKANWNEDATKTVVAALREQADEDKKAEVEGALTIPAGVRLSTVSKLNLS